MNHIDFCKKKYNDVFINEFNSNLKKKVKADKNETISQKKAIRETIIEAMNLYKDIEASEIWKTIYAIHVHRKSGIIDKEIIDKVISADQSWKKSSGHAFEEMIKLLGNDVLSEFGITIYLQKEINHMIQDKEIHNEVRDMSWLKEQIKSNIFDLYSVVSKNNKNYVFGCIQSKTSIRDRVTRDREPSLHAMEAFFWSVAIVLDGDFLKLGKFQNMVNGGTTEHVDNGWHGMYVFSDKYTVDRIYPVDIDLTTFVDHAKKASEYWLTQRQWFNNNWRA